VDVRDARQTRDVLVDARVVFHGARAERIEDRIDREVALGEMGEMAQHVELAELGQTQLGSQ